MTHRSDPARTPVTRRRVVTTAAHAAWTTPVVLAVTGAPATASSLPGGPLLVAGQPTFTPVFSRIRVSTPITNNGTATPTATTVGVILTPVAGTITDRELDVRSAAYALVSRTPGPTPGAQTLSFRKVDPQIAPGGRADLTFDFYAEPAPGDPLEQRRGTVTVSPAPEPGTGTSSTAPYGSGGNPPAVG